MPPKKPAGSVVQAEVALQQSLKNCLVHLPASLVSVLVNANAVAQNVVVELSYRQPPPPGASDTRNAAPQKSLFVGWTGMQSKRRLAPVVDRNGLRNSPAASQQDIAAVEVDATFARLIGLSEGQKVGIQLHLDPPQAHTINIEPLTPVDWEMIELHAQFLELNFLSQIRALPNPQAQTPHPLTLHLSPTTTANIIVTSVAPAPPAGSLFVKISPDAEVIVAPKTRQKTDRSSANRESRSVGAASRKSGKSAASTVRRRGRDEAASKGAVFLRGVDRSVAREWFDEEYDTDADGLRIWVDKDVLLTKALRGATWVSVAVIKPAGLQEPVDMAKEQDQEKAATRVIARIGAWEDAPDSRHVALSSDLCRVLGCEGFTGGLVRIEGAPSQTPKPSAIKSSAGATKDSKEAIVKSIKVLPFSTTASLSNASLKFGGESKQEQDDAIQKLKTIYGRKNGLLDGPISDGMVLPPVTDSESSWQGGIVKFEPAQPSGGIPWVLFPERKPAIELGPEIATPSSWARGWQQGDPLPKNTPELVGIDSLVSQLRSHLTHHSSVLLSGGLGAGKTECAQLLAHQLRTEYLFNTIYFPCRKLVTDETRVATIKETLNRLFATAAWCARSGGNAVVILDDLDKLCPVETELQVGNENGRSRHVSESIVSIVRQYCSIDSGVVLLATAQGKEALNNVIVGGHIVREMVSLKAPSKDGRRKVLEKLAFKDAKPQTAQTNGHAFPPSPANSRPSTSHRSQASDDGIQHDTSDDYGFVVDTSIDFLDLAGQTDGYMPGDLVLLTSRARNESLIRSVTDSSNTITLTRDDYASAIKGFTPASLRNVTLQSSTTKWDSIGGLTATRQILLETLQYPTTYAPIFAQCPLRLRSGLLLYGFPGCGKTLLASAVAGECGLNFISVKGPEILNKYIGASEKSVRDLFERAEAARPCVLFFDEFDSIAPKRGHDSTGVTDRVVNQLLTQMDGAEGLSGVYVLAATSRPDLIDPALLRPGRLDKSLLCDMPDASERIDILKAVTRKLHLNPSILTTDASGQNLRAIADRTDGYSGADLQAVVYNAQLAAIHDVLDDADPGTAPAATTTTPARLPEFSYFRYADPPAAATADPSPLQTSTAIAERARVAQDIAALQLLRRKQKLLSRPPGGAADASTADGDDGPAAPDTDRKEPQIQWRHIASALDSGRSSISAQERGRLGRIYREFVEGREGNLPSGQGGSEIGGRTSLM
ncbi:P-loop containing nucleoside triphosphate hydrolase protein [Boeremia exigua]|uniref:P-loop containing nucleoside triphosphate hydrolase protein n=1 Tax=Boeremia exigua TaxID=749465 RepID=UPI001E8D3E74|nr:P-loop containing nucleoside triphosphate hydrolase protein [Boeremia exigua]KAH6612459.1 P-loop containing nucleoside triphosphate hydrolase protein [Boeremia exigua]